MSESPPFETAFSEFIRATGRWRDYDPVSLVDRWNRFATECLAGYSGDIDDYFNDLTVRGSLAKAMNDPTLQSYSEMTAVESLVAVADERLRQIVRPDVFPRFQELEWWNRGVVRYAGPKLVEGLRRQFGIEIDGLPTQDS